MRESRQFRVEVHPESRQQHAPSSANGILVKRSRPRVRLASPAIGMAVADSIALFDVLERDVTAHRTLSKLLGSV